MAKANKPSITVSMVNVPQGWIVGYSVEGENMPHLVKGCFPRIMDAIKTFTEQYQAERGEPDEETRG